MVDIVINDINCLLSSFFHFFILWKYGGPKRVAFLRSDEGLPSVGRKLHVPGVTRKGFGYCDDGESISASLYLVAPQRCILAMPISKKTEGK